MTHPRIWIQQDESKQDGHAPDSKDAKSAAHAEEHAADEHAADEHSADPMDHYLDPKHMIEHVQDTNYFELPAFLRFEFSDDKIIKIPIPFAATKETKPVIAVPENEYISPVYLRPTKFMILEVVAAVIIFVLFTYLARQIKNGDRPKGKLANMLESLVVFIRDEVARPAIGKKDADRYLPFIWTIFFFILTLNLFGMIPLMGTATGALGCTIALALITFAIVLGSGMKRLGVVGFWKAQAPHMDLPAPMKLTLVPVIWGIEVFGLFIKHIVLAVRLFANMFAGHLVLGAFVAFIGVTWGTWLVIGVLPGSIVASVLISLLELLVALIQAYVFAFLASLFIGAALHPH